MQIIVNGEPHASPDAASITDLLERLAIANARVAVEVNEAIVPRDSFATHQLHDGDRVEIVHFVGGG